METLTNIDQSDATRHAEFSWNPEHPIGTCADCGEEMTYNVPRLGKDGGFIHKLTGSFACPQSEVSDTVNSKPK